MNINDKQDLADIIDFLKAANATGIDLPVPSSRKNSTGDTSQYADCWWDELIHWSEHHPEEWLGWADGGDEESSELIAYYVTIDAKDATLIVLSYPEGGFENCCLVPGHLTEREDIVKAWFGDKNIEDYRKGWDSGNPHAILVYCDIPNDWFGEVGKGD